MMYILKASIAGFYHILGGCGLSTTYIHTLIKTIS
nr:MAG TPA_asm: hypothetical protein [Caudoviricetes sp.]